MESNRLKQLRMLRNKNQTSVARNLNLSREAYSMYETGRRQPSYETLEAMARYFHVSMEYLLGSSDIPFSYMDLDDRDQYIVRCLPRLDDRTKDYILGIIQYQVKVEARSPDNDTVSPPDSKPDT